MGVPSLLMAAPDILVTPLSHYRLRSVPGLHLPALLRTEEITGGDDEGAFYLFTTPEQGQ